MLKIKKRQMDALRRYVIHRFEDMMCLHLLEYFPKKCAALGEQGVREVVRYGIDRAAAHGIEVYEDMCSYIDLMFCFGRDFDVDPRLPWAREILDDPKVRDAARRIRRLRDAAERCARQRGMAIDAGAAP